MSRRKVKLILISMATIVIALATALLIAMTQIDRSFEGSNDIVFANSTPSLVPLNTSDEFNQNSLLPIIAGSSPQGFPAVFPSALSTSLEAGNQTAIVGTENPQIESGANHDGVQQDGKDKNVTTTADIIVADTGAPQPGEAPVNGHEIAIPSLQPSVIPTLTPSFESALLEPTTEIALLEALETLTPTPVIPHPATDEPSFLSSTAPTVKETTKQPSSPSPSPFPQPTRLSSTLPPTSIPTATLRAIPSARPTSTLVPFGSNDAPPLLE